MAWMASLYPRGPYDATRWLKPPPRDGGVPGLPEWKWLHVPGHTPGQIALWRKWRSHPARRGCVHHDATGISIARDPT